METRSHVLFKHLRIDNDSSESITIVATLQSVECPRIGTSSPYLFRAQTKAGRYSLDAVAKGRGPDAKPAQIECDRTASRTLQSAQNGPTREEREPISHR